MRDNSWESEGHPGTSREEGQPGGWVEITGTYCALLAGFLERDRRKALVAEVWREEGLARGKSTPM